MKVALLIVAVLALAWLLRSAFRRRVRPPDHPTASKPTDVKPMVACAQCGVLIPSEEALPGRGGVFCGKAHRDAYLGPPPNP